MNGQHKNALLWVFLIACGLFAITEGATTQVCDFEENMCGWIVEPENGGPDNVKWKRKQLVRLQTCNKRIEMDFRPAGSQTSRGYFAALDVKNKAIGTQSRIRVNVENDPHPLRQKSLYIAFFYASISCGKRKKIPPVTVNVRQPDGSYAMIGKVQENTGGNWVKKEFTTCVGKEPHMYFEGEKVAENAMAAIDYVVISRTYDPCPNQPTPSDNATTDTPTPPDTTMMSTTTDTPTPPDTTMMSTTTDTPTPPDTTMMSTTTTTITTTPSYTTTDETSSTTTTPSYTTTVTDNTTTSWNDTDTNSTATNVIMSTTALMTTMTVTMMVTVP